MKTDWSIIPTHIIDVGNLTAPSEICKFMKSHDIDKYMYRITYKGIVLKFGMSADNSKIYGDRIYRQIAHASFWEEQQNQGSSGRDFRGVEEALLETYGIVLQHEHLKIKIWDVTNYPFFSLNPAKEIVDMESELVQQHIDVTGERPMGNIEDKKYDAKTPGIPAKLYNNLFTEADYSKKDSMIVSRKQAKKPAKKSVKNKNTKK